MANTRYTYNVREYGARGDDVADDYSPIYQILQLIDATASEIYFPPGTYVIGTNLTFPSNVTVNLAGGAILSPTVGITVTISGALTHANTAYTGGAGTVTVATQTFPIDVIGSIGATSFTIVTNGVARITVNSAGDVTFSGHILAADGTAGAPSISFASETDLGFLRVAANALGFVNGGSVQVLFQSGLVQQGSAGVIGWASTADASGAAADVRLIRDAANTLALVNGTNAQHLRVYGTTTGSKYTEVTHDGVSGIFNTITGGGGIAFQTDGGTRMTLTSAALLALPNVAIPAGGTTGSGILISSTSNFGVFFGSNVPSLSAAKGSLYLRSDGSSGTTRAYINTDGGTTWTAINTVA